MVSYVCVKMLVRGDHIMGANVLVAAMAAAIGAVTGVAVGYIIFDSSVTMIKLSFIDWLTNRHDAICGAFWGLSWRQG